MCRKQALPHCTLIRQAETIYPANTRWSKNPTAAVIQQCKAAGVVVDCRDVVGHHITIVTKTTVACNGHMQQRLYSAPKGEPHQPTGTLDPALAQHLLHSSPAPDGTRLKQKRPAKIEKTGSCAGTNGTRCCPTSLTPTPNNAHACARHTAAGSPHVCAHTACIPSSVPTPGRTAAGRTPILTLTVAHAGFWSSRNTRNQRNTVEHTARHSLHSLLHPTSKPDTHTHTTHAL